MSESELRIHPIKRMLVAIDRSVQDKALMTYISRVNEMTELDAIYFLHIANDLEIPEEIAEKFPDLLAPMDESIKKNIDFEVKEFINMPENIYSEILVREGNVYQEILKVIKQKEIDILVLGRKSGDLGSVSLVRKLARTVPCSLSIIPEYVPPTLKKVLVPIDFSDNSVLSLQMAELLSSKFPDLEVHTLNAYEVPTGYSKTGKSFEEFSEIMLNHAKQEGKIFHDTNKFKIQHIENHFIYSEKKTLPAKIYQFAAGHGMDAILIGSRGRGTLSHLILGSITESIIEHDQYLPLLIIKSRKEGMDLLDVIKNI